MNSNTYSSLFDIPDVKRLSDYNFSMKVQETFKKAYIPNTNEFPCIETSIPPVDLPIVKVYKLTNTKLLDLGKIKIKTAETYLSELLNSTVFIRKESDEPLLENRYYLEVYKSSSEVTEYILNGERETINQLQELNKKVKPKDFNEHFILWKNILNGMPLTYSANSHLLIVGLCGSGKSHLVRNIKKQLEKHYEENPNDLEIIELDSWLDDSDLEEKLAKLERLYIKQRLETSPKAKQILREANGIALDKNYKKSKSDKKVILIIEGISALYENNRLTDSQKLLISDILARGRMFWIYVISTTQGISSNWLPSFIRLQFWTTLLFKVKNSHLWDIVSKTAIWIDWGASIPRLWIFWRVNLNNQFELYEVPKE